MNAPTFDYSLVQPVSCTYEEAIDRVTAALKEQGFGILTEIDVAATLKSRLGVDSPRTIILGACNPGLAHRAMTAAPDISVLLPCNVVVRENAAGQVEIATVNPAIMGQLIGNPQVQEVATEADRKIRAVLAAMA